MSTAKKIVIGLGIAGGAALAAWLLTGSRKKKTKAFFVKTSDDLKQSLKKVKASTDEDIDYV